MTAPPSDEISPRPRRQPPPGPQVGVIALCGLAVALAVMWWWQGRPEPTPVSRSAPEASAALPSAPSSGVPPASAAAVTASASAGAGLAPSATAAGTVTVDVRGAVVDPGPQRVPVGSRVIDAIEAAGGLQRGRSYGPVNLARVVTDGEQIRVGPGAVTAPGTAGAAPSGVPGATSDPGGLIDLNSATEADLEELDGVGPVLAGAIVRWRTDNGPFTAVEDLLDVSGIGDATLESLRSQVTVG